MRQIIAMGLLVLMATSCKTTDVSNANIAPIFNQEQEHRILSSYVSGDTARISEMAGGALFGQHPPGELKSEYPNATGRFTGYGLVSESRGTFQTPKMAK